MTDETALVPEITEAMSLAFERCLETIPSSHYRPLLEEILAKLIFEAATHGVRDPDRLYADATERLTGTTTATEP
jgi:hypothetical protein